MVRVRRHRQRAQRLGRDLRQQRRDDLEGEVDLARAQRRQHRRCALVRNDHGVDAGAALEELGRQMLGAAGRDRADAQLAGPCLRIGQQLGDGLVARTGVDEEREVEDGQRADRREVFLHIERQLLEQARADRIRIAHQQQRVAVGRGLRDRRRADEPTSRRADEPTMLPALGRWSTTTVWPSVPLIACAPVRAVISAMPPGANGTISVIGRSGKRVACARAVPAASSAADAIRRRRESCVFMRRSFRYRPRSGFARCSVRRSRSAR